MTSPRFIEESIVDLIGNTPMVSLHKLTNGLESTVLAKLEFLNPEGSVKDRIGISMIKAAEKQDLIHPGMNIPEPEIPQERHWKHAWPS